MLLLPLSPVSADLLPSRPRLLLPANLSLGLFLCGEREKGRNKLHVWECLPGQGHGLVHAGSEELKELCRGRMDL